MKFSAYIFIFVCLLIAHHSVAQAQLAVPAIDSPKKVSVSDSSKKAHQDSLKLAYYQPYAKIKKPKGPPPIKHELSVGVRLNTDGWSAYTDIGKIKTRDTRHSDMFYDVRFWQIEFSEKKDPGEEKTTSDYSNSSGNSTYIYGKINNFYALKLGYGFRRMLAGKPDPGCVSIHWVNVIGASIGLLKPYYLDVYSDPSPIKYSQATAPIFLSQSFIEGSAGFSKGLGETQIIPGLHYKSALHFDFSTNRKNVIAFETGINIEYYTQAIALMANRPSSSYFLDAFLAFQFGRRW